MYFDNYDTMYGNKKKKNQIWFEHSTSLTHLAREANVGD